MTGWPKRKARWVLSGRTEPGERSAGSRACPDIETLLAGFLTKARFWESIGASPLNDRQRLIPNKLLDGFDGKLTIEVGEADEIVAGYRAARYH